MFSDVARISSITKNMTMPMNSTVIYNTTTNAYEYFDGVAWVPFTNFQSTGEPTGFPLGTDGQIDLTRSVISFNNGNRNFSIKPLNDYFYFYHSGREFKKSNEETIQIDNIEGQHYIYYDQNGVLQKSNIFSYDIILKNVFVAIIYWDTTNLKAIYVGDERHGCTMDAHTHARIHAESGAVYVSGMDLNFIYSGNSVVDGNGNSPANLSFAINNGVFRDEDIIHNCPATDFNINMPIYYRTSPTVWRRREGGESVVSYRLMFDNNKIVYNKKNGNVFTLESPSSGKFVLYHLYVINDAMISKTVGSRDNKYVLIAGTYEYNSVIEARYNAINEISEMDNFPFIESVAIASIIYEHNNSYTNIAKARIVSSDGQNFIDWRKKINLKPLTALGNSHNYLGGIYGKAPYYHSNQPISTTDDVTFNNLTLKTNKVRFGVSNILTNGNIDLSNNSFLIYQFDMTTNPILNINFINGTPGDIFYLKIKNSNNAYNWNTNIKWPSNIIPLASAQQRFDVYCFVCFSSTLFYGTFAFDYAENETPIGGTVIPGANNSLFLNSYTDRQLYLLNVNDTVTISSIFGSQTSGSYRFFNISDTRISGTLYLKENNGSEPDVRLYINSDLISVVKDTDSKLNIYILSNLLTFQNKTNSSLSLIIYREI